MGSVYNGKTKIKFPNAEGCKKGEKCSDGNKEHPMFNVASDCVLSKIKLFKSNSPTRIRECMAYAGGISYTGNIARSYCVTDSNRAIEIKGGYKIKYISFYYELYNNKSAEAIYKKELRQAFGYYPSEIESYASNNNNSRNKVMSNVSPEYVSGPSTWPGKGATKAETEYWPGSSWTGYTKRKSVGTWTHKNWMVTVDWALMCKITVSAEAGKELRIQPVVSFARHCEDGPKDGYSGSWAEAPADTRVEPGALTASLSYSEPSVSTNNVDANALGGAFAVSDIINDGYPHLKCFYWQDNTADFAKKN